MKRNSLHKSAVGTALILSLCAAMFTSCAAEVGSSRNIGNANNAPLEAVGLSAEGTVEDSIAAVIASEKDALEAEYYEEKANDPIFDPAKIPDAEGWQKYSALVDEFNNLDGSDPNAPDVILQKLEALDAEYDGKLSVYYDSICRAADNYSYWAYYNNENSPYKSGTDQTRDFYYANPLELYADSSYPSGMIRECRSDLIVTAKAIDTGSSIIDLADLYTSEQLDKEIALGGFATTTDRYIVMEITECYYGGLKAGDLIMLAPRFMDEKLEKDIAAGGEWMLLLGRDGMYVDYDGQKYETYSTPNTGIYLCENGKVKSTSVYLDLNQYDGLTPEELTLQVLRIRTKYFCESGLSAES